MRRLSTCKVVNLQFSFFSTPIWLERIFICSITPMIIKILIFCEIYKLQSLFYFKITLNHACEFYLRNFSYLYYFPKSTTFFITTKKITRNLQLISKLPQKSVNYKLLTVNCYSPGGPIPQNMARALMPRQPYSEAVLSTGGRFSSSSLRGEDRDERWSLL